MMIICDIDCRKKQNQFYKEKTIFCSLRFVAIIEYLVIMASLLILVVTPIKWWYWYGGDAGDGDDDDNERLPYHGE